MAPQARPSWRKLVGIIVILLVIALWALFVASLAPIVGRWPVIVQAAFYLFTGIVWIAPLKPLIGWIETGRMRAPEPRG
jgi:hypothetical protein